MTTTPGAKLRAPMEPLYSVDRERLLEELADNAGGVTILEAPAGFGKTTLLSQFFQTLEEEERLWFSFDIYDTISSLLFYLGSSLIDDFEGLKSQGALSREQMVISELTQRDRTTLCLDDYHIHEDPEIHEFVGLLARRLSPGSHLIVASRKPLPFSPETRMESRVLKLTADKLRLVHGEMNAISKNLRQDFSEDEMRNLENFTEGWPALFIISSRLLGSHGLEGLSSLFRELNPERSMDKLWEEVFKEFSSEEREHLLKMSLVERFTAELWREVCACNPPEELLSRCLVRGDSDGYYQLHHLAIAYLRARARAELSPQVRREVHYAAARFFEREELWDEAIQHSLECGEWARAGRLIKGARSLSQLANWCRRSQDWFKMLPGEEMDRALYSRLGIVLWIGMRREQAYQAFKKGLGSRERPTEFLCLAGLAMCCEGLGFSEEAEVWYQRAADFEPEGYDQCSLIGRYFLMALFSMSGDVRRAEEMLRDCQAVERLPESEFPSFLDGVIGFVKQSQGLCALSLRYYRSAAQQARRTGNLSLELLSWGFVGSVHYELGRLEAAEEHWERYSSLERTVPAVSSQRYLIPAYLRFLVAMGRFQEAVDFTEGLCELWRERSLEIRMAHLRLRIELGLESKLPLELLEYYSQLEKLGTFANYEVLTNFLRFALRDGDLKLIEELLPFSEAQRGLAERDYRLRHVIEVELLEAQCYLALGRERTAHSRAASALERGRDLGLIAIFLEQPRPFWQCLFQLEPSLAEQARTWSVSRNFSDRELEFLELLGQGLNNREMSEALFLSLNTVKWHNRRIYKKLGVRSRMEAQVVLQNHFSLKSGLGEPKG